MMRYKKLTLFSILCWVLASNAGAQDVHFSMFDFAPLYVNPAYTGAYEGTFRVGGIYRNQNMYNNQTTGYQTPLGYIDAPLFRAFGENDWVGAGLQFYNDSRGSAGLSTMAGLLSLAYHFPLTSSRNVTGSIGISGGFGQDKIDKDKLRFESGYDGSLNQVPGYMDPSVTNTSASYMDLNAGALFNFYLNSKINFNVGVAGHHLTQPDKKFITGANGVNFRKYVANAGANIDVAPKLTLSPLVYYQYQQKASELNMQAMLGYHLNPEKTTTLQAGLGYRWDDAAIIRVGLNYKGLRIGASYDFTTSSLSDVNGRKGGFEIGAAFIAKIYPKKIVPNVLMCPRLM